MLAFDFCFTVFELASFEDFKKIDLRVGKILECAPVEGADKLYKLAVDLGSERRTIVSGIAEWYSAEQLVGRKIVVVANLEPKTVRGVASQGMLLAAEDGKGGLSLVTLDDEHFAEGAAVH